MALGHPALIFPLLYLAGSSRLMQRKFSEPNTYIDGLPSQDRQEMLYDDVEVSELTAMVRTQAGLSPPPPTKPQCQRSAGCP